MRSLEYFLPIEMQVNVNKQNGDARLPAVAGDAVGFRGL